MTENLETYWTDLNPIKFNMSKMDGTIRAAKRRRVEDTGVAQLTFSSDSLDAGALPSGMNESL